MSSFKAKIFIDGEERNLLFVEQEIRKYADITGRPNGKKGMPDVLRFAIESTGNDSFFYHHMFSPNSMISGEIVFYKRDGFSVLFKIEFANAYILNLSEEFDHNNNLPLHMLLEIGWGIVRYKGVIIEKYWNPNNPWEEIERTEREVEQEGSIIEAFFEDVNEQDVRIEKIMPNKELDLIIKTENMNGKAIDIDLSEYNLDFEYEGKIVEGAILEDINISADTQRISLKTTRKKH